MKLYWLIGDLIIIYQKKLLFFTKNYWIIIAQIHKKANIKEFVIFNKLAYIKIDGIVNQLAYIKRGYKIKSLSAKNKIKLESYVKINTEL